MRTTLALLCALCIACGSTHAADSSKAPSKPKAAVKTPQPKPTEANVAYGTHERQVLDFYQAQSSQPTPVVLNIHGGGWVSGDKASVAASTSIWQPYLGCFDQLPLRHPGDGGRRETTG